MGFQLNDEVLLRRRTSLHGPPTAELRKGKIVSIEAEGEVAVVSVQKVGGKELVKVPIDELSPVTELYKRTSVQMHPAFGRGYRGSV